MYPVSGAYKTAIQQNVRDVRITGAITLKDNSIINITDEDIVQGSLYVTEQCVAGEDIEVGNVYASEMGLSLSTPLVNPYSLDGARILLHFGIDVGGGVWETVPLGYFYVTEIQRKARNVNLTALDGMLLFDIPVGDPGSSSPRNLVVYACAQAGVTLGTSVFEIDTFANAGILLAEPDTTKIKTCRDLLMWACQVMGCFARMNRSGQLEIVPIKARTSVKTISKGERFNSDVSDFAVKITKVSMQIGETEYSRGTEGMTMVLDENPLMAGLSENQINQMLDYFLAQITTAVYVPFNSNFIGDPALQPGDYVTLSDTSVLGSGDVASIITHSMWRYRGPHNLKAAGKHGLVRGVQNQQIKAVSSIVAIARAAQDLALSANQSAQLIKDAIGGHVLIRQNPDETNEILIMDHPDPEQATKIWRWNMGGLGYSDNVTGADNPDRQYEIAMTMDGAINANFIKTGQLDAGVVTVGADTKFEKGYDPVDNHLYFQYSVDGTNWHDVFNSATDLYMRQKVGDNGTWSEPARIAAVDGEDGYTPVKGVDYFDGVDGQDGTSAYLWVRYSQNSNGNPMTTDPTGAKYIGIATTTTSTAPTDYGSYLWSLIKGTDGIAGEKGADGQTSYLHIKYSDDGVNFTANNGEDVGAWIGTYVDFNPVDSMNFNDYTWNKVKGTPIVWKGDLANPPSNPEENWVYRDTDNGYVYIYNGTAWELMVTDGADGIDGAPGADGMSVYITYHNNPTDSQPATPTGDGTSGGWYTAPSAQANWMSQKVATNAYSGTWGAPILISGGRKFTSQPVPPYDVGDLWIGGSDGQNTLICTTARSSGSFVASDWERMTEPVANMGVDSDCLGLWHFDGTLNSHKGLTPTFTRNSAAYLSDGTKVEANKPRFEVGKFGQAVLVEEGTTNAFLLKKEWSLPADGSTNAIAFEVTSGIIQGSYTLSADILIYSDDGTVNPRLTLILAYTDGTISNKQVSQTKDGQWHHYTATVAPVSGKTINRIYGWVLDHSSGTSNKHSEVKNIQLEAKPYPTSFVDGTRVAEDLTIPRSSSVLPSLNAFTIAFRAYPHLTKIGLESIAGTDWARTGLLEVGNYYTANESNVMIWKNNPDGANTIKVTVINNRIGIDSPKITLTQAEWAEGPMIVLRYDGSKMYLDTFTSVGHEQVSVEASITHPVADLIRIGRAGGQYINGLLDELRIDRIYRTDAEIRGWYKANAPFYTSEDMKQLPGYLKAETDGIKVYDSSDALRVLLGSWLSGAIRKYGLKIIGGEIYSTMIQTGEEGDDSYTYLGPVNESFSYPFGMKLDGKRLFEIMSHSRGPIMNFYDPYYDDMVGAISTMDDASGQGLRIQARNNGGYARDLHLDGKGVRIDSSGQFYVNADHTILLRSPYQITLSGDTHVSGNLTKSGTLNYVEPTKDYGIRLLNALEAPELKYVDMGRAQLVNGEATVYLDPILLQCIEPDTDLTPWLFKTEVYGLGENVRVIEWGDDYFKVKEENSGTSNRKFGWWFYATRINYAGIRLQEYVAGVV